MPQLELPKFKEMSTDSELPKLEFPKLSGGDNKKPEINCDVKPDQEKS